ncbi:hypothetical protein ACFWN2_07095 [Lentzea sp. NPDC058436]|uniref:hypothetical protein n=1 Tax=Lentzea sp. NPDC058436 TaxID=3346499 RepID=UPI00365A7984
MICWDRRDTEVVGYFDEFEIGVLRGYAASLLRLIAHRAGTYTGVAGRALPPGTTADPRLLAILRAELGESEPDWVLACQEAPCLAEVAECVRTHLGCLPPAGGLVTLGPDAVVAWARVVRWYLAVLDAVTDESGRATGKPVTPTLAWFTGMAAGLRNVVEPSVTC